MALSIRAALTRIECGVVMVDGDHVELINPSFRELFGLAEEPGWEGRPLEELVEAVAPAMADGAAFRARLQALSSTTAAVNEDIGTADGRVIEREYLPVVQDGIAVGHVGLYWDVSSSRAADLERLRRQRAEIIAQQLGVHAQRSRAAEAEHAGRSLAEQNRVLAASNDQRKELLATASHELRTPLTSILGFSELLGDTGAGTDVGKYAAIINRNARALLDVVDDLLLLASLGATTHRPAPDTVRVADLVADVVESLAPLAAASGVTVETRTEDSLRVLGDAGALRRVLSNVIGNAVKYSDTGGSVTVMSTRAGDVGDGDAGNVVQIDVRDCGMGIPDDEIEEVFGQFFRASTARRSGRPGSGLGLAIARSLVTQHGGTIALASRLGTGTTVTIRLPVAPPDAS